MNIRALAHSTSVTIILITLMTILGELSAPLKSVFASIGSHHWVGKGIIALVAFVLFYFIFLGIKEKENDDKAIKETVGVAVISAILIFIYFVLHTNTSWF